MIQDLKFQSDKKRQSLFLTKNIKLFFYKLIIEIR